ncbi:hypothetical protein E6H24_06690 [Candidatus Bathyarchaeota archaeon]|nr:MAG: hypothetical protein E6H24_06690 [Candidatus Bathyarchaeota archaeon]
MRPRKYGYSLLLYLLIPTLAAIITWATGILVVSHSQGELGPQTPSYGFPLPWITVGYAQGCLLVTPYCFTYSIDWVFLTLDILLYSSTSFALTTIILRATRAQFSALLPRQMSWSTVKTIMAVVLITIAFEPIVAATSLPQLPCVSCPQWESLTMVSYWTNSPTNLTLSLKNAGSLTVQLFDFKVQDGNGNQWSLNLATDASKSGPIPPNATDTVSITIGSSCGNCTYQGSPGAFTQFTAGNFYSVIVVTARNLQFPFVVKA